jgi:hypothetical protein
VGVFKIHRALPGPFPLEFFIHMGCSRRRSSGNRNGFNWGRKKIRCCFRGCTKRGDVREMGMQIFRGRLSSLSRGENVCTNVRAGLEGISLDK